MDFDSFLKKYSEYLGKTIDKSQIEECKTPKGKLSFLRHGNLLVSVYGFDYIDSEFYSILQKLEIITSKNKLHIIIAENKDKANSLSEIHFGQAGANEKESQYSMLSYEDEVYIFFNYARLQKENITFLVEYLDMKASMLPSKETQEKVFEIYQAIMQEYVKSVGYKEAIFNDAEIDLVYDFRNVLLHSINDPFVMKLLVKNYQNKVLDSLKRRIKLFSQGLFNKKVSKLHDLQNFLSLTTLFLGWSIDISIASNLDDEVRKLIYKIISDSKWGDYIDFKNPFMDYFDSLLVAIPLCKSQDEILDKYLISMLELVKNIPKKVVRLNECMLINNRAIQLISFFQIMDPKTAALLLETNNILKETDKILKYNEDPVTIYFIREARSYLLEQFSITTHDKELFDRAYKESLEQVEFIEKNYKKIKAIFPKSPISQDDIVFAINSVGYLCFCHQQFDKFREIRVKIKKLLDVYKISTFTRIMINQLNFALEEDYESLKEIYRLSRNYVSGEFKFPNDSSILAGGAFAEAFFSDDIGIKSELYNRAIAFNKNSKLTPASLQKDISQMRTLDQVLRLFYHLDISRFQESPYTFISEIKTALKIASEDITKREPFESIVYFFLKTKVINLFIEGDYKGIDNELDKIRKFDFPQCKEFDNFIIKAIESMNKEYNERLLFITSLKETNDLWIRVIIKFIKHLAEQDFFNEFKQTNKELSKIKDMKILLEKFKSIILDGAVRSFWKKAGIKLNSNPEDIGRSHLIVFLRALNKFEPTRETEVNFYKMDLFVIDKVDTDKAYIIETKVCEDQTTFEEGIKQLTQKYVKYKKESVKKLEAFYVVFDSRKKLPDVPSELDTSEGKVNIIHIPINKIETK